MLLTAVIAAVVITWLTQPDGVIISSDPGADRPPLPLVLLPSLLIIAAVSLCPPRALPADHAARVGESLVQVLRPGRLRTELLLLLGIAVAFPALAPLLPLPEDYVLLKALLLLALAPALIWVLARRGGPSLRWQRPTVSLALLLAPVGLAIAMDVSRALQRGTAYLAQYPLGMLIVGAVATAVTAGIGEEVFYRRLLQTRLEALTGRWPGILLASLIFGLMHLPSHGLLLGGGVASALGLGAAQVIAIQGTTGIAFGWAWSRYRRLWVPILMHLSTNGTAVVVFLLTGQS
ncbi:CPBP family intramembrane metalloprotease [Brachybacterium sp. EF45031]|uniref:CPBP family intramembrane glutamic endopeptidase n=1 Tax=Brachybacterium sillae TaxID=2810536 RepID=UPI00217CDB81|nr:CPBP family intramembrane glutamic endopeptidase [Brachybacterium sillae]MCS6711331.1 CPBP family intramembrane metalloprotease [Brachybacterium sillae]